MKELTPLNIAQLIKEEIATQYRNAGNLKGYIQALLNDHDFLDAQFQLIADRLNIDTQQGRNLDVIGEIVGASRGTVAASDVAFFGLAPHPLAKPFGSHSNAGATGGRWRSKGESLTGNKTLTDSEYRTFIKAQIFKNHGHSTPDELIRFLKLILGTNTPVYLTNAEPRPGHGTIRFGRRLTVDEKFLLTDGGWLPVTLGVTYHFDFPTDWPLVTNQLGFVAE